MNQEILTLIIVFSAASYTLYVFIKQLISLFREKSRNLSCSGCTECAFHTIRYTKPELHNLESEAVYKKTQKCN